MRCVAVPLVPPKRESCRIDHHSLSGHVPSNQSVPQLGILLPNRDRLAKGFQGRAGERPGQDIMLAPCNASREHILADTLLRAANDGYDVSPLIECGADPMASGAPLPHCVPFVPLSHLAFGPVSCDWRCADSWRRAASACRYHPAVLAVGTRRRGPARTLFALRCAARVEQEGHQKGAFGRAASCGWGVESEVARAPPNALHAFSHKSCAAHRAFMAISAHGDFNGAGRTSGQFSAGGRGHQCWIEHAQRLHCSLCRS